MIGSPKNILLIIKDETDAQAEATSIRDCGYDVTTAFSLDEALSAAAGQQFDLGIIDLSLEPDYGGPQAAEWIQSNLKIPVILRVDTNNSPVGIDLLPDQRYGCVAKGSGKLVLTSTIETACELFAAHRAGIESELKYRTIADFTYDWEYWITPDGSLLYNSPSCERITGFPCQAFIDNPGLLVEIIHPDDRDLFRRHLDAGKSPASGILECSEGLVFRIKTRNGGLVWINHLCTPVTSPDGRYLGRRGSNRDITILKLSQAGLARSEMRLRQASEMARLGYYDINLITGESVWSDETFHIFGLRPDQASPNAESYRRHVHPEDVPAVYAMFNESIANQSAFDLQYRILTMTGEVRRVHSIGRVEAGPSGDSEYMFGTLLDITSLKEAEEEVGRLLAEKEILLREIHHRVKNNLATLSTLLMLQANQTSDSSAQEALHDARGRIMSMLAVYDRLYRSGSYKSFNLKEYFGALLEHINNTWLGVSGIARFEASPGEIVLPLELAFPLGVVVNELVTNSLKYAFPNGSSVEVVVKVDTSEPHILSVTVADNGQGLPGEIDLNNPGTFGLSLVQILSNQLRAKVDVSQENGTVFHLRVPY